MFIRSLRENPNILLLLLVYVYIGCVALSYAQSWMHPELLPMKKFILNVDAGFPWHNLQTGFNYDAFEFGPRIYRPLSAFFEIMDTQFRVWLWRFIPPHPSLSLTFIFSLILSPLLLIALLKRLGFPVNLAIAGAALYLASPGLLSVIANLNRPAKAMTNFSFILCMYLASRTVENGDSGKKDRLWRRSQKVFPFFIAALFVSFFWDETALLIYPTIVLFFPKLFSRPKRFLMLAALPFLVGASYLWLIPRLTVMAGYPAPILTEHHAIRNFFRLYGSAVDFWTACGVNLATVFSESLGLAPIGNLPSWITSVLMRCYVFLLTVVSGCAVWRMLRMNDSGAAFRSSRKLWFLLLAHIIFLTLVFTFLMDKTAQGIWSLYGYGIYLSIFVSIWFVVSIHITRIGKRVTFAVLAIVLFHMLHMFPYTNYAYKKFHFYPYRPNDIRYFGTNQLNRFAVKNDGIPADLYRITKTYWQQSKRKESGVLMDTPLPKELMYLAVELGTDGDVSAKSYLLKPYLESTNNWVRPSFLKALSDRFVLT